MRKQLILMIIFSGAVIFAQSNTNPDISLIGAMNMVTDFSKGITDRGKLKFTDPEMELFVEGYLNPFARAAANIAYEDNSMGVEELYVDIVNNLPLDMQIRAGKFLVGFGKLNTQHPHAWPFLNRPLVHQVLLGPEGMNEVGINFNYMLPIESFYSGIDIGLFKGESILKSNIAESEISQAIQRRGVSPIVLVRVNAFTSIGDYSNLEAGFSVSGGLLAKEFINQSPDTAAAGVLTPLKYTYWGIDLKYKYKPDSYTSLVIQGEAIFNKRDAVRTPHGVLKNSMAQKASISTSGGYIYADYRFDKVFSAGIKYDITNGIIGGEPGWYSLGNDDKSRTYGYEAWLGYYPVEETLTIRAGVQHLIFNTGSAMNIDPLTTAQLQIQFSLGPHKAHPF